jgi:hypothetical protein
MAKNGAHARLGVWWRWKQLSGQGHFLQKHNLWSGRCVEPSSLRISAKSDFEAVGDRAAADTASQVICCRWSQTTGLGISEALRPRPAGK